MPSTWVIHLRRWTGSGETGKGTFHRDGELTPLEFAERYVKPGFRDMVCLVNDPRPDHPYFQTYTIGYLGNVVGARSVRYLNVPIEVMKT